MAKHRALKVALGVALSFAGLVAVIFYLVATNTVSFEFGLLMLVALLGMYVGFGVLIAVYRFIGKLE
jgi:hypothetical protein